MRQSAAQLNKLQIREQEALNRQRRLQDETAARRQEDALRRTKAQYDHVASHGYGHGGSGGESRNATAGGVSLSANAFDAATARQQRQPRRQSSDCNAHVAAGDDVQIQVYVRECDDDAGDAFTYRECASASPSSRVGNGPVAEFSAATSATRRSPGSGGAASRGGVNGAREVQGVASASSLSNEVVAPNRARVPRYLQQRKAEMAAEKAAVAAEAERQRHLSQIPVGHRRVSEDEKADTLRRLEERQQELVAQLSKIPIRFDTQSIQQRRRAIEEELRALEAKRQKYSTKNALYVPME